MASTVSNGNDRLRKGNKRSRQAGVRENFENCHKIKCFCSSHDEAREIP